MNFGLLFQNNFIGHTGVVLYHIVNTSNYTKLSIQNRSKRTFFTILSMQVVIPNCQYKSFILYCKYKGTLCTILSIQGVFYHIVNTSRYTILSIQVVTPFVNTSRSKRTFLPYCQCKSSYHIVNTSRYTIFQYKSLYDIVKTSRYTIFQYKSFQEKFMYHIIVKTSRYTIYG